MTVVVKRNRRRQKFDGAKLRRSIDRACLEAGLPAAKRRALVEKVAREVVAIADEQDRVRTVVLREWVLYRLDKAAPAVSRCWRDHDREKKGIA
jgi:transcriptional regulator NrdR family protein